MSAEPSVLASPTVALERADLDRLIDSLAGQGYEVLGPIVRDGAAVIAPIRGTSDLPVGWRDEQSPGTYRLTRTNSALLFDVLLGPDVWKRALHPPRVRLWRAAKTGRDFELVDGPEPARARAFFGVRPCDLAAIAIQDRVFLGGGVTDPVYGARRDGTFLVVAQCVRAGATCFCASMGAGPAATAGFDLALTELDGEGGPAYAAVAGSERGQALLDSLGARGAPEALAQAAEEAHARAAATMGRTLDTHGLAEQLARSRDHAHWNEVASRCLACGNCTQVCPTCFCTSVEDRLDLGGAGAERVRRWDSCFSLDYSYIHGGSVRPSIRARYRQWLTHKLGSWHDQFGTPGCVGCGRCITWCPAGIDFTAEAAAFKRSAVKKERQGGNA